MNNWVNWMIFECLAVFLYLNNGITVYQNKTHCLGFDLFRKISI